MSIQERINYHTKALADKALEAKDPRIVQGILSDLSRTAQSGAAKPYEVIPLISAVSQHLQGLNSTAAMQQAIMQPPTVPPQGSIGAGVLQQARAETAPQQPQGITSAASGLPAQYASGGIVAFGDGGEVEHYKDKGYVVPSKTPEQMISDLQQYNTDEALRQKYQPSASEKLQQMMHLGADFPLSAATEQVHKAMQSAPETPFDSAINYYGADTPSGKALTARKAAWISGTADPYTGGVRSLLGKDAAPAPVQQKPQGDITIHDTKPAKDDTIRAPAVDVAPSKEDAGIASALSDYDKYMKAASTDREDLRKLILGSDEDREKSKNIDLLTQLMGFGFGMAGGRSHYAAENIGAAGKDLAQGIAQINAKQEAAKDKQVAQLVQLGLSDRELNTKLAQLGISKAEYLSKAPYYQAEVADIYKGKIPQEQAAAWHYMHPTSAAGMPKGIASETANKVLDAYSGYATPMGAKDAPFYAQDITIPLKGGAALTWGPEDRRYLEKAPDTQSGRNALAKWNKIVEAKKNERLTNLYMLGGRTTAQSVLGD